MRIEIKQYKAPKFRNPDNHGPQKKAVVEIARKIKSVKEIIHSLVMGGGGQVCFLSPSGEFAYSLEEIFCYCLDVKKNRGEYQFADGSRLTKNLVDGKIIVSIYEKIEETPLLRTRKKLNLTQAKMAKLLGTTQHRISEIERRTDGRTETAKMLRHLEALDVVHESGKIRELLERVRL